MGSGYVNAAADYREKAELATPEDVLGKLETTR